MKINLKFFDIESDNNDLNITSDDKNVNVRLNINDIDNYDLMTNMNKIKDLFNIYNKVSKINIKFDKNINNEDINKLISKSSDILYNYNEKYKIKMNNISDENYNLMKELTIYKNIVMDPNKNPDTYLSYIKARVPINYKINVETVTKKNYPLTNAVGTGSKHDSYFVHIYPKKYNKNSKDVYLIGKAITYDSGGLNLKSSHMAEMKVDMIGSGIITSVLNLLTGIKDYKNNIHLIIPIAENMISNTATKPGMVIRTMTGKTVEITDTDAEGRLCIADALEYTNKIIKNKKNSLIIDVATLTGNTQYITSGVSSIIMGNNIADTYINDLINLGEETGEYLDYLKIRKDYLHHLQTPIADIKNHCDRTRSGCVTAGAFLNYFTSDNVPWIHLDVASSTFINNIPKSYGINLLFEFLKNLKA